MLERLYVLPATRRVHNTGRRAKSCSTRTRPVSGQHFNVEPFGFTADGRPVHPLPRMHQAVPAEEPVAGPAAAAPIVDHRFGFALHIVHLAVIVGMVSHSVASRSPLPTVPCAFDAVSIACCWRATSCCVHTPTRIFTKVASDFRWRPCSRLLVNWCL